MMKLNYYIFILTLIIVAFSCKKNDPDDLYGPCEEQPIGTEPLYFYSVQFGVTTSTNGDLIDFLWPRDSVHLFDEFENEIEINWHEDLSGHNITDPLYFFDYSEDSLAFDTLITNVYYIDFHDDNFIDRDTLEIRFKVEDVTCGQILNPLEFYQNQVLIENYGYVLTRRINFIK